MIRRLRPLTAAGTSAHNHCFLRPPSTGEGVGSSVARGVTGQTQRLVCQDAELSEAVAGVDDFPHLADTAITDPREQRLVHVQAVSGWLDPEKDAFVRAADRHVGRYQVS